MTRIYICSPYAGVGNIENNIEIAKKISRELMAWGITPVPPHLLYPQIFAENEINGRMIGLNCALSLLETCQELWVYLENGLTEGMEREIDYAVSLNIVVRKFHDFEEIKQALIDFNTVGIEEMNNALADSASEHIDCENCEKYDECQNGLIEGALKFSEYDVLWALKELDVLYGGGLLPNKWWEDMREGMPDLLLTLGVSKIISFLEFAESHHAIPPLPFDWKDRFLGLLQNGQDAEEDLSDLAKKTQKLIKNDEWHSLGNLFADNGDFHWASFFFTKALKENPKNTLAAQNLAICQTIINQEDELFNLSSKMLN